MHEVARDSLHYNLLLASLSRADSDLLDPYLTVIDSEQGLLLQEAGDPIEHVYFPHTGMISVLAVMRSGDAVETATIGHEGAVGTAAGLGARIASGRAVQQIAGRSSRISAKHLAAAVNENHRIRDMIIKCTDVQMALVQQSAGCNALHPVQARLCRWLLQSRDRSVTDVITLTQEFLSEMLGVHRTTVTLLGRDLQALGLISYRRGKIEIIDRRGLEQRACECYATVLHKNAEIL